MSNEEENEIGPIFENVPASIWLCIGDDFPLDETMNFHDFGEDGVTWCDVPQDRFDIKYVRASVVDELRAQLAEAKAKLNVMPADWSVDSSLATWFPLTAKDFERTKRELAEAKKGVVRGLQDYEKYVTEKARADRLEKELKGALTALEQIAAWDGFPYYMRSIAAAAIAKKVDV